MEGLWEANSDPKSFWQKSETNIKSNIFIHTRVAAAEAAEARTAAAARDFYGSGSGRGSFLTETGGNGSGRGSDVIIAVIMLGRTFQELSFEPNKEDNNMWVLK